MSSAYVCLACAVQAVEASVSWASWALDQGLITASELHPAPPSSTKPMTAQSASTEAHTTAAGEPTGLLLLQHRQGGHENFSKLSDNQMQKWRQELLYTGLLLLQQGLARGHTNC